MDKNERARLRELIETYRSSPAYVESNETSDGAWEYRTHNAEGMINFANAMVNALPSLLDALDAAERDLDAAREERDLHCGVAVIAEAERDAATKQRDEAEAAGAAMRAPAMGIVNALSSRDARELMHRDASFADHYKSLRSALARNIGKAWLRERDELRERVAGLEKERDEAIGLREATRVNAFSCAANLVRRGCGFAPPHGKCDHEHIAVAIEGYRDGGIDGMIAALDRMRTPPAPSDDNGGGNG